MHNVFKQVTKIKHLVQVQNKPERKEIILRRVKVSFTNEKVHQTGFYEVCPRSTGTQ